MINARLERILKWVIRIGIVAILFLPLFVYRPVLYPYVFSKILVFQIIVEIIFVAWLFLMIYCGKKYRPNFKNPLILALTIFIGFLILTSFTGVDIGKSFFSTQERMTGVITIIHFYIWFLILSTLFKNKKDWMLFLWSTLSCSFLLGLYGLGQKIGLSFLLKDGAKRMSATLGNPDFLGVYSLMHIFLAGILMSWRKKKVWKILAFILLIFNLVVLFLTATRGAIVAFGISAFVFLLFLIFRKKTKKFLKILLPVFLLIVIGGSIFLYANKSEDWMKKAPLAVRRLMAITPTSNQARLKSWNIGLKGFQERPVFGWGIGNYNVVFNKHYDPWYLIRGEQATWFDQTHNQIIDLLALTGVFGTLSYLAIFFILFWLLRKKYVNTANQRIGILLLACMFLAYFIQNLFVFDTPASLILFYFSLSLIYFITSSQVGPDGSNQSAIPALRSLGVGGNNQQSTISRFPLPVLIFLIILFIPFAMYRFNVEPWQQSQFGVRAVHATKINLRSGLRWYGKSLSKPCFTNIEVRTQLAKQINDEYKKVNKDTSDTDLKILAQATELTINEFKKSVIEHSQDVRQFLYLGQLYNLASGYNREYVDDAKDILLQAKELSPQRQQVYYALGRAYLEAQEYEKAVEIFKEAYILEPKVGTSRKNLDIVLKILKENNSDLVTDLEEFLIEKK